MLPVVGIKESYKREVPFELSLEIKVWRWAGGKGWASHSAKSKSKGAEGRKWLVGPESARGVPAG